MVVLLYVLAVLCTLWALLLFGVSKGAVHEIQAWVALLTAAVLLSGGAILSAVNRLRGELPAAAQAREPEAQT